MKVPFVWFWQMFKGDNWCISSFWGERKKVGFFSNTLKVRSSKLCMVITLFGVYVVIVGLMTLTLFQGQRYVRIINCKLCVLDSCPLQFRHGMVATYIKKILHDMFCVTLVCIQGRWLAQLFHQSSVWACRKLQHCDLLRHRKYDKCQTLHDGTTCSALLVHTTFSDLDHISKSQQCETVLTENFVFLSDEVETL